MPLKLHIDISPPEGSHHPLDNNLACIFTARGKSGSERTFRSPCKRNQSRRKLIKILKACRAFTLC